MLLLSSVVDPVAQAVDMVAPQADAVELESGAIAGTNSMLRSLAVGCQRGMDDGTGERRWETPATYPHRPSSSCPPCSEQATH